MPIDPEVDTLIIALRDSRRRHLEARLARDALTRAKGGKTNDEQAIALDRAASDYWHDIEELEWRLKFALAKAYSRHPLDPLLDDAKAEAGGASVD